MWIKHRFDRIERYKMLFEFFCLILELWFYQNFAAEFAQLEQSSLHEFARLIQRKK